MDESSSIARLNDVRPRTVAPVYAQWLPGHTGRGSPRGVRVVQAWVREAFDGGSIPPPPISRRVPGAVENVSGTPGAQQGCAPTDVPRRCRAKRSGRLSDAPTRTTPLSADIDGRGVTRRQRHVWFVVS